MYYHSEAKTMKKILSILLAALTVITLALPAFADEAKSGTCGANATWSFDSATGKLTVSGSGNIYSYGKSSSPFYAFRNQIKEAVIEEGITGIGQYAFSGFTQGSNEKSTLEKVKFPSTLKLIDMYAFSYTSLKEVSLPEGLEAINTGAFAMNSSLTSVTLPKSIKNIHSFAFNGCTALSTVNYAGSEADKAGLSISEKNDSLMTAKWNCNYGESFFSRIGRKIKDFFARIRDLLSTIFTSFAAA